MTPLDDVNLEHHHGDDPDELCVWCCGCAAHPIGKPWGWNYAAWEQHYDEYHALPSARPSNTATRISGDPLRSH